LIAASVRDGSQSARLLGGASCSRTIGGSVSGAWAKAWPSSPP